MKNVGINEPCSANFANMTPTTHGAFCQQCTKQVLNFTEKSTDQIRAVLHANKDKSLCVRMTTQQEQQLNDEFLAWKSSTSNHMRRASIFAIILVFGLSIVSCADEQDKQVIQEMHQQTMQLLNAKAAEILHEKINDSETNKPFLLPKLIDEPILLREQISHIQGEMIMTEQVPDPIEYNVISETYTLGGAMSMDYTYEQYLDQIVPLTTERYDEHGLVIPTSFSALAFPNPTNGAFTLKLEVPTKMKANISVYSLDGRMVESFEQEKYAEGTHEIALDLSAQVSGTYIIAILSKDFKENVRVVKL